MTPVNMDDQYALITDRTEVVQSDWHYAYDIEFHDGPLNPDSRVWPEAVGQRACDAVGSISQNPLSTTQPKTHRTNPVLAVMTNPPKKPRQKHLPAKAELLREVEHWKWRTTVAEEKTQPWLRVPGLVIYLDTTDTDYEARLEILALALRQLKR